MSGVGVVLQGSVEVTLLTRILLVNIDAITHVLIATVLHGIDTAGHRMLCNSYGVPQTPTQERPLRGIVKTGSRYVQRIKGFDLTAASGNVGSAEIYVVIAATRNVDLVVNKFGCYQRAGATKQLKSAHCTSGRHPAKLPLQKDVGTQEVQDSEWCLPLSWPRKGFGGRTCDQYYTSL